MDTNLTPEQVAELKKQLEETKLQLEESRRQQVTIQTNSQDKFLETLFDKGGQVFVEYTKMSTEALRYSSDKNAEVEKEELKVINRLDTKEKLYKGGLIALCVVALVLTALYVPKAEIVIPVLSLIIGLLFKSSSLSDFFSHTRNKYKDGDEE